MDVDALHQIQRCAHSLVSVLVQYDVPPGAAWGPADADGLHAIGEGWFQMDWMARQGVVAEHCGMGEVGCRDMEPTLWEGCAIIVDRSRRSPVPPGRIFMVRIGDARVVRRLRMSRGRCVMYGDHPLCPPATLPSPDAVVGQVLWSAREHADDAGRRRSALIDEEALRENLAAVVSLIRGLNRRERNLLLEAARSMPVDDLLRVGLDASHAVLESAKELA